MLQRPTAFMASLSRQDISIYMVRRRDTHEESMVLAFESADPDIPCTGCPRHGVPLLPNFSCADVTRVPKSQCVVESRRLSSVSVKLGYA